MLVPEPSVPRLRDVRHIPMMVGWTMGLEGWLWIGAWMLALLGTVWLLVREPRRGERDAAMEILRDRLGRGEISPDEFERARRLLSDDRPQRTGGMQP